MLEPGLMRKQAVIGAGRDVGSFRQRLQFFLVGGNQLCNR
jgi:hypothetical protein